jgi:hypothetical protein
VIFYSYCYESANALFVFVPEIYILESGIQGVLKLSYSEFGA